jgi:hypothetical protein
METLAVILVFFFDEKHGHLRGICEYRCCSAGTHRRVCFLFEADLLQSHSSFGWLSAWQIYGIRGDVREYLSAESRKSNGQKMWTSKFDRHRWWNVQINAGLLLWALECPRRGHFQLQLLLVTKISNSCVVYTFCRSLFYGKLTLFRHFRHFVWHWGERSQWKSSSCRFEFGRKTRSSSKIAVKPSLLPDHRSWTLLERGDHRRSPMCIAANLSLTVRSNDRIWSKSDGEIWSSRIGVYRTVSSQLEYCVFIRIVAVTIVSDFTENNMLN